MSCKYNNSLYSLNVPDLDGQLDENPEEIYLENQISNHLEEEDEITQKGDDPKMDDVKSIEEPYENTNEYFVESEPLDDYFDPSVEWEKVNHDGDHDWISYMEEYTKRVDLE